MNVPNPNLSTPAINWLDIAKDAVHNHDCQQIPSELACLLALLDTAVKPETVLEIGAWRGGSAWAWAHLPTVSKVVSVDLSPERLPGGKLPNGVEWEIIGGDSATINVIRWARAAVKPFGAGLVWIDANHTDLGVRLDWKNYGPMVARGGLVAFHDINDVPQHPDCDVAPLWAELRAAFPSLSLVAAPGQIGGTGILLR
jgi:cephalosporin hydroxylase